MSEGNSFHFKKCGSRAANYYCICEPGFTGYYCKINIDECASNPCVHGKCVDGINQYDCVCKNGYWGKNCEKKITKVRGESCLDTDNKYLTCLVFSLRFKIMDPRFPPSDLFSAFFDPGYKCKGQNSVRNLLCPPRIRMVRVTYSSVPPRSGVKPKNRFFQIYITLTISVHGFSACPKLGTPFKGYKNCSKTAGRAVCTLKCLEGHSFDVDAETMFECGPDTTWRWNRLNKVQLPRCSSK